MRFRINEPQSVDQETLGSDIAGGVRRDDLYNLYGVAQLLDQPAGKSKVIPRRYIAGYSRCRLVSSHRKSEDGFSTEAVDIMDMLFEGIRSITTRIYKGMVIVEKGCANLTRFMGLFLVGKNTHKRPMIGWGAILDGQPKLLPMILEKVGRWNGETP
jgi:hypothetical protein